MILQIEIPDEVVDALTPKGIETVDDLSALVIEAIIEKAKSMILKGVYVGVELTQQEALCLQNAMDLYLTHESEGHEPAKDLVDKINDALTNGGYDPGEATRPI